jgi:malonate-semialdehyde dehydrogenase (acetylating)/methylmalonate-semialdehyde dehydrogenase
VYDKFKERFIAEAASMKLGYGLNESTAMGPYCTQGGRAKVENWVSKAVSEGAKIAHDGRIGAPADPNTAFMGPIILENMDPDMETTREEAFGAVAGLLRMDSLDQVIQWINNATDLGHSACIMTQSGKVARKFTQEVIVGNVGINVGVPQPYAFFPLGSKRKSFLGGAKSRMASMRLFLDEKTVTARWV